MEDEKKEVGRCDQDCAECNRQSGCKVAEEAGKRESFPLRYIVTTEAGKFTPEELKASGHSGTDRLIVLSCLGFENGGYGQKIVLAQEVVDGKLVDSHAHALFNAWLVLGASLADHEDLDATARIIAGRPLLEWVDMTKACEQKDQMVSFDAAKLRKFKKALKAQIDAGKSGHDTFEFDGKQWVVGYARYAIEYMDGEMKRRGISG